VSAKDIVLRPVSSQDANALVKRVHYSGTVVQNSQLHIGVFWNGKLEGALQFGPSLDKRKIQALVEGTGWNQFIELNRMVFSAALPRNSESRALAIAMRLLRKHAPHLKWIVTFADGAQCGDGTIYRAAGFLLTGIRKNTSIWAFPDGTLSVKKSVAARQKTFSRTTVTKGGHISDTGGASMRRFKDAGAKPIPGFQLRYIAFIDPSYRERLTVPVLPYSAIQDAGAGMYKGQSRERSRENAAAPPRAEGGVIPTRSLHLPAKFGNRKSA
jgi:hypothetical protein